MSTKATDYSWITRDSRYSRIDPDEFPPQVLEVIAERLANERADRERALTKIREGADLAEVFADKGASTLHISDLIEALPNRRSSVTDTMTDLGFIENCPLSAMDNEQRQDIFEKLKRLS